MSFAKFGNDLYTGKKSFQFVTTWRRNLMIGLTAVLLSIAALFVMGINEGIDFRGGSEFMIQKVNNPDPGIAGKTMGTILPVGETPRTAVVGKENVRVQTLRLSEEDTMKAKGQLAEAYGVPAGNVSSSYVGPSWGKDITRKALLSLVIFLILVTLLITIYFHNWAFAAGALVALVHDLCITAGVYSLTGFEVTPATAIGFLTILGYSLYDTVVVFDKIRENTEHVESSTKRTFKELANLAINQTLVRSINTSVVAILPVAAILFIGALLLGAGTLKDIALSLFIGMLVGAYSSVFIAPAIAVAIRAREPKFVEQEKRVMRARAKQSERDEVLVTVAPATATGADLGVLDATPPTGGQRYQPKRDKRRK